jgi:Ran GTPase-activating protein (RanGAP) involved in mRNA processing and transport
MQELNISGCTGIDATTVANVVAKNRTLLALIFGERMDGPATLEIGVTEADFSDKNLGIKGAIIISAWITHKDKGALLVLNLASNNLKAEGIELLAEALKGNQIMTELNVSGNAATWDGQRNYGEMSGVIALADAIPDMEAMTSLHVGMNAIPEKEMKGIIVIAMSKDNMKLLCEVPIKDKTLTELDVSGKSLGTEGALVVAEYLRDKGAVTKFDISDNSLYAAGGKVLAEALNGNQVMTELNLARNTLGLKANSDGEADMSGIIALADVIPGMGALSSLDLSNNKLTRGKLRDGFAATDQDFVWEQDTNGVIALANVIKDNGAMTSLNLASNRLGAEGAKIVAEAIKVAMCTPAIILVPFSCPSDFSINCCCLLLSAGYGGDDKPESCRQLASSRRCQAYCRCLKGQ